VTASRAERLKERWSAGVFIGLVPVFVSYGVSTGEVNGMAYLLRAWLAGLELAFRALVDEPVRSRVAHVAIPEDQGGVGLDDFEAVFALSGLRHCVVVRIWLNQYQCGCSQIPLHT